MLKRYRTEKGTGVVDELFEGKQESELFATSYFTILEVTSVATRLLKANSITRRSHNSLLGAFMQDIRQLIMLQPVSDLVLSRALDLILDYDFRAPDAVQLATALIFQSNIPNQPVYFICTDARLKAACVDSGLVVLDPEEPDSLNALKRYRRSV